MKKANERPSYHLKAAKRKRLYEDIVTQIQDLIQKGELRSGDQLPPERKLSEIFMVSRNSVREAIRALEEKQIVKTRHGNGTYVIVEREKSIIEPLANAIQQEKDKIQEIFLLRRLIEPQLAYLAAENSTAEDIVQFKAILHEQERKISEGKDTAGPTAEFHMLLARASKNTILFKIMKILEEIIGETREEFLQSKKREIVSFEGHVKIIKAIEKRDPDLAWKEMNDHLLHIEETVLGPKAQSNGE